MKIENLDRFIELCKEGKENGWIFPQHHGDYKFWDLWDDNKFVDLFDLFLENKKKTDYCERNCEIRNDPYFLEGEDCEYIEHTKLCEWEEDMWTINHEFQLIFNRDWEGALTIDNNIKNEIKKSIIEIYNCGSKLLKAAEKAGSIFYDGKNYEKLKPIARGSSLEKLEELLVGISTKYETEIEEFDCFYDLWNICSIFNWDLNGLIQENKFKKKKNRGSK